MVIRSRRLIRSAIALPLAVALAFTGVAGAEAATVNQPPTTWVDGPATQMDTPMGITASGDEVFVINRGSSELSVYNRSASGNIAPIRKINGIDTQLTVPYDVTVHNGEIYVTNDGGGSITVYPIGASGNQAPTRSITGITNPKSLTIHNNKIYVATGGILQPHSIRVYDIAASGAATPLQNIVGGSTELGGPAGIATDGSKIYVTNQGSGPAMRGVLVFDGAATGNVAPIARIVGSTSGLSVLGGLALSGGRLYVANQDESLFSSVRVFAPDVFGDPAPLTVYKGVSTALVNVAGISIRDGRLYALNSTNDWYTSYPTLASVSSVAPASVHYGSRDRVTVSGISFGSSPSISFNGVPGTETVAVNDSTLTTIPPVLAPGPVTVTVTTSLGTSANFTWQIAKAPQHLRAHSAPSKLKNPGTTVINKTKRTTVEGQPLTATVKLKRLKGASVKKCATVRKHAKRKVTLTTRSTCKLRVTITYRAPATSTHDALHKVVKFTLSRRR